MQLEVYSRKNDRSLWLSVVGNIDVIRKFGSADVDCEVLTPTKDYVVTEVFTTSRPVSGITFVQFIFSEDFGIHEDPSR